MMPLINTTVLMVTATTMTTMMMIMIRSLLLFPAIAYLCLVTVERSRRQQKRKDDKVEGSWLTVLHGLNKVYSHDIIVPLKQNTISCTTSQTAHMSTALKCTFATVNVHFATTILFQTSKTTYRGAKINFVATFTTASRFCRDKHL